MSADHELQLMLVNTLRKVRLELYAIFSKLIVFERISRVLLSLEYVSHWKS
jgi:hypothetical protein